MHIEHDSLVFTAKNLFFKWAFIGSFIHTGHGDTNESNCWGYVDKIDEIYLRNPILNGASAG